MNALQPYSFKGAQVRALADDRDNPWFVAKDVCDVLGIDTNHLRRDLDADEITEMTNLPNWEVGRNGGRTPLIISESGLYSLALRSRKPEAKEFKRWITREVIPSIRKHGGYMAGQESMTPEQMALKSMEWLHSVVAEQRKQLEQQDRTIRRLGDEADSTRRQLDLQKPYAAIGSQFVQLDGTVSIQKVYRNFLQIDPTMTMNRVFQLLRENGYIERHSTAPTQKALKPGYLKQKIGRKYNGKIGKPYAVFTAKGIGWFITRFIYRQADNLDVPTLY